MNWRDAMSPHMDWKAHEAVRERVAQRRTEIDVYPPSNLTFRALQATPYESVKVVIIGQDPYHGPGQANGLAFAVNSGLPRPPSLRNIILELQTDLGREVDPRATTLLGWAKQGVLLLNTALTVEHASPGSHAELWKPVTTGIVKTVANHPEHLVFMLWGKHAQQFDPIIRNVHRHKILDAAHPSPFSVAKFFGCKHFTQANQYLAEKGKTPIDWTKIDSED